MRPGHGNPHLLEPAQRTRDDRVMSAPPLRVMLVDDHEVVRDGIRLLLNEAEDVVVRRGCACTGGRGRRRPGPARCDRHGRPPLRRLRDRGHPRHPGRPPPDGRAHADQLRRRRGPVRLDHGRRAGYVLKQIKGDELVRAIRAVGGGQNLLDPAVTKESKPTACKGKHLLRDEKLARSSPQEERILGRVADGRTNGQIAAELGLAEKTVKNYVSSILSKLEVARRAEAAAYLARHTTTPGT